MDQRLSFVTIAVNDFALELTFYEHGLGWKPFFKIDGTIAFFNVGNVVFSLCSLKELSTDVGMPLSTNQYLGVTISQNVPDEQAVDQAFAKVRQAAGRIVKEPQRASWGGYSGYFADPEGHLWEVAYNPQFKFDDHGNMIVPQ